MLVHNTQKRGRGRWKEGSLFFSEECEEQNIKEMKISTLQLPE